MERKAAAETCADIHAGPIEDRRRRLLATRGRTQRAEGEASRDGGKNARNGDRPRPRAGSGAARMRAGSRPMHAPSQNLAGGVSVVKAMRPRQNMSCVGANHRSAIVKLCDRFSQRCWRSPCYRTAKKAGSRRKCEAPPPKGSSHDGLTPNAVRRTGRSGRLHPRPLSEAFAMAGRRRRPNSWPLGASRPSFSFGASASPSRSMARRRLPSDSFPSTFCRAYSPAANGRRSKRA